MDRTATPGSLSKERLSSPQHPECVRYSFINEPPRRFPLPSSGQTEGRLDGPLVVDVEVELSIFKGVQNFPPRAKVNFHVLGACLFAAREQSGPDWSVAGRAQGRGLGNRLESWPIKL